MISTPATYPTPWLCHTRYWSARSTLHPHTRALRWHRLINGWSQEALGLAAGLDRSYVGTVERMEVNVSMDKAEQLATAFGMSLVALVATEVAGNFR